jgi:hypothetical protein
VALALQALTARANSFAGRVLGRELLPAGK